MRGGKEQRLQPCSCSSPGLPPPKLSGWRETASTHGGTPPNALPKGADAAAASETPTPDVTRCGQDLGWPPPP